MCIFLIAVLLLINSFPENSLAQESFPTRPVTMVIESGAGGMADIMTRALCKAAEKELGQPIVCENKPGAAGTICKNYVVKSKPDGYTIGSAATSTNINIPHMREVPYNVLTDLKEIMAFQQVTHMLCVKTDAPWKTFENFLKYAKQNPGKLTYATAGVGFTQHIVMERIAMKEGIDWRMVPFKSGADSVLGCLGGHVNAVAQGPADVVPHVQSGKLRVLLPLSNIRASIAPDISTVLERYGFFGMSYQAVFGPAGISEYVREKLQNAFKKAMNDASFIKMAKELQVEIVYLNGKDYENLWKSHYEEMGNVIRAMGLGKK